MLVLYSFQSVPHFTFHSQSSISNSAQGPSINKTTIAPLINVVNIVLTAVNPYLRLPGSRYNLWDRSILVQADRVVWKSWAVLLDRVSTLDDPSHEAYLPLDKCFAKRAQP